MALKELCIYSWMRGHLIPLSYKNLHAFAGFLILGKSTKNRKLTSFPFRSVLPHFFLCVKFVMTKCARKTGHSRK